MLENDSRYLVDRCVLGAGVAGAVGWPQSRRRSGLVMGAVQSGKTASMLGVAALALDAGVDVVVVLGGTRVALWRQTYDRFTQQLGVIDTDLVFPSRAMMSSDNSEISGPSDLFQLSSARIRRALRERAPLVLIVMKHGQHLHAASKLLHERVYPNLSVLARPMHVLVLDDEADDGSILDAVVEGNLDPAQDAFKQIPRHVVGLWSLRGHAPTTVSSNLYATYVGYTATPQANFLQADQNPLAPRDFIAALRTPFTIGDVDPRSTTFREPQGISGYYTGGEAFYRLGGESGLVVTQDSLPDQDEERPVAARRRWISEALRAYLVAGAVRLWRDGSARRLSGLTDRTFATLADAKRASPSPHSMLFHPSAAVKDHFQATAEVLAWARNLSIEDAQLAVESGCRRLSHEVLSRDIDENGESWRCWLDRYGRTADAVAATYELEAVPPVPSQNAWGEVRDLLESDVIPNVRIAIVNSDPDADDRPEFEPQPVDGSWRPARDIFTIFVSGNVMSRGLTLEGLATTLFLRSSGDPAADTQMQMQRWFGYRGSFLELCRVFLPVEQLRLYEQYHETDEALRRQLIEAMNLSGSNAPRPLVIEGERFRATGKIAGVSKVPLCPGATPFIDIVNDGFAPDPNVALLAGLFGAPSTEVVAAGTVRGRILDAPLSLDAAASMLDQLSYGSYVPDPDEPTSQRWSALEAQLGLANDAALPRLPLFRPPSVATDGQMQVVAPGRCPYNIAAYLRLWRACLTRHARGLFPTEDGERPWALLDLAERRAKQPAFYVGLRFGSADPFTTPQAASLSTMPFVPRPMLRRIERGVLASGTWGSRNPGESRDAYLSDQLFDYHHHREEPIPTAIEGGPLWRPVGAPGLILLHLIRAEGRPFPVLAVGVGVPLGGPDHFAARARK